MNRNVKLQSNTYSNNNNYDNNPSRSDYMGQAGAALISLLNIALSLALIFALAGLLI